MIRSDYYELSCWKCGSQIGWKSDYSYPMPSIYCNSCKEQEERENKQDRNDDE